MTTLRSIIAAGAFFLATSAFADTIDVSFSSGIIPPGSPSVYTAGSTFTLPPGFTNASLTVDAVVVDDRGVLQLNGTNLFGAGIFGPGSGFMTFSSGGPNDPFFFAHGNGVINLVFTTGFLTGLNTLNLIINDTNQGIFGAPLGGGTNITSANVVANVDFTPAAIPEPSTYALMLSGLVLVGFAAKRMRKLPQSRLL